jgi:hypothetical protein
MVVLMRKAGLRLALIATALLLASALALAQSVWAAETGFAPAQSYSVGQDPFSVTDADFDGDGNEDLAVATQNSNTSGLDDVSVLLNDGDGTFGAAREYQVGQFPNSVISADFDENGNADLAVANACGSDEDVARSCDGNVSVLSGKGDGTFAAAQFFAVGTGNKLQSVDSDDFNGDGNLDLAVAIRYKRDADGNSVSPHEIAVLLGNGDGTFGAPKYFGAGIGPYDVTSADLNKDGKADLAVANADSNNVSVLLGNGDGTFGAAQNFNAGNAATSVICTDLNQDGKKDLAVAAYLNGVSVLLGNGDGTFGTAQNAGFSRAFAVTSTDFDGDGNLDLAAADVLSDRISIARGNGNGTFLTPQTFLVTPDVRSLITADFNGDQKADIATANHSSSSVSVLQNATLPQPLDTTPPSTTRTLSPQPNAAGWNNSNVTVTLNATDTGGSGVKEMAYSINGGAPTTVRQSSVQIPVANKGTTTISYHSTDNANNVEPQHTFSVKIDNSAPSAPVISSPPNNSFNTDGTITISGTAEANSSVQVFEATASGDTSKATTPVNASGAWTKTLSGVSNGSHTYKAKAKDAAENTSGFSNSRTVLVDKVKPKVTSTIPSANATGVGPGVNVKATFSEAMRATSINTNTFQLFKAGTTTPIAAVVISYDVGTKTATLNPDVNLRLGTKYKAVITTGTRDLAGNWLDQNATLSGNQAKVWYFTTRN